MFLFSWQFLAFIFDIAAILSHTNRRLDNNSDPIRLQKHQKSLAYIRSMYWENHGVPTKTTKLKITPRVHGSTGQDERDGKKIKVPIGRNLERVVGALG
jgi:hypothetical protein